MREYRGAMAAAAKAASVAAEEKQKRIAAKKADGDGSDPSSAAAEESGGGVGVLVPATAHGGGSGGGDGGGGGDAEPKIDVFALLRQVALARLLFVLFSSHGTRMHILRSIIPFIAGQAALPQCSARIVMQVPSLHPPPCVPINHDGTRVPVLD